MDSVDVQQKLLSVWFHYMMQLEKHYVKNQINQIFLFVDDYKKVVKECARVLKPGGLFFFHTFNRNLLSFIMIIKGVEWFVKNTPHDMHVYDKFIKPLELEAEMMSLGLKIENLQGLVPDFKSKSFFKMLIKKEIDEKFRFKFIKSKLTGYVGYAQKTDLYFFS